MIYKSLVSFFLLLHCEQSTKANKKMGVLADLYILLKARSLWIGRNRENFNLSLAADFSVK